VRNVEIYKGITFGTVECAIRSKRSLLHYFVLLSLFCHPDLDNDTVSKYVSVLKNIDNDEQFSKMIDATEDAHVKVYLGFLKHLQTTQVGRKSKTEPNMSGSGSGFGAMDDSMRELESTTLGKLAKEIMNEVDVSELQKSIQDEGDILKSLANPEGGFAKLLGTVSQKMIGKLASGEIKQETLLQDALQFSGKLKGMLPKEAQGLGDLGDMMSKMNDLAGMMGGMGMGGGGNGGGDGFDMSNLANMMNAMKGGGGDAKKGTRTAFNTAEMSRVAKAKQMRRKLEKRRRADAANASDKDKQTEA
jgi:hypothetical protein